MADDSHDKNRWYNLAGQQDIQNTQMNEILPPRLCSELKGISTHNPFAFLQEFISTTGFEAGGFAEDFGIYNGSDKGIIPVQG